MAVSPFQRRKLVAFGPLLLCFFLRAYSFSKIVREDFCIPSRMLQRAIAPKFIGAQTSSSCFTRICYSNRLHGVGGAHDVMQGSIIKLVICRASESR